MLAKTTSCAVLGVNGYLITIEVDIAPGLPSFSIVGLPDASVKEARDRVVAAVRNSGFDFPVKKITVNLAPASIKKEGASFDLPIAAGILCASEMLESRHLEEWGLLGELALDGSLRPVKGILPMLMGARAKNLKGMILPLENLREAQNIEGIKIFGAKNLKEAADFLNSDQPACLQSFSEQKFKTIPQKLEIDFSEVKGQRFAKRALEIAASGGHNVLMVGPPGSGKTMLAKRLVTILPPLTVEESLETTKIYSVSGAISQDGCLTLTRPFRNPHHTISNTALVGGGAIPRPGEVSLAHNGVLFLDELPEFTRDSLEALREPLESREVTVARTRETVQFPANFMLVAAMNPCPCGFQGHPVRDCVCPAVRVQKYMTKISGPLLDRIDLHLEVPALKVEELTEEKEFSENSSAILKRVMKARKIQKLRFKGSRTFSNSQMNPGQIKKFCKLDLESKMLLRRAVERLGLSARAYDRILKVARSISDLASQENIEPSHVAEAVQYRSLDRMRI